MSQFNAVVLRSSALLAVGVGAAVAFALDWRSPLRTALALAFLLFVPGLAVAELLEVRSPLQRLALATGTSLALETVACLVLLYAGAFSVSRALAAVVGITTLVVVATVVRAARATE